MEKRKLGHTDIMVPIICLGTMTWGRQNTEEEAHEQLDYAVSQGINFIDTAEIYPIPPAMETQGLTETYIGTWLAKRGGKRDDLILTSKVGNQMQKGSIRTRNASGLTRENIREAIEGSLSRLQTDYIDLYQVHGPDRPANYWGVRGVTELPENDGASIEETLSALAELLQEGKIRAIGVSNESPWGIMQYLKLAEEKGLPRIVSIQNQYSLVNRTYEIGMSEISLRENIGLLPYSPLSAGALTGKYLDGARPEGSRFTLWSRSSERYLRPNAEEAVRRYVQIAKDAGIDPATLAIAFSAARKFVTSSIIGATSLDQLKVDIAAGDFVMTPDLYAAIDKVYQEFPDPVG